MAVSHGGVESGQSHAEVAMTTATDGPHAGIWPRSRFEPNFEGRRKIWPSRPPAGHIMRSRFKPLLLDQWGL